MSGTRQTLNRLTTYVVGASIALTVVTFVVGGPWRGVGAAVGGLLAVGNWYGMRWIGERILRANDKGRAIWGTLLAFKMAAILGVVWAILSTGLVDTFGFAVGMSGLVLGLLAGAFHLAYTGEALASEES